MQQLPSMVTMPCAIAWQVGEENERIKMWDCLKTAVN